MPHRYFTNEINGSTAFLRDADARHLAGVMRGKLHDSVILCDGKGRDYDCEIVKASPDCVELAINTAYSNVSEASVEVTLYIGYPKQDKLEEIIDKATQLGAVRIVPFFSRYCIAKEKNEQAKNERYMRIAKQAAEQSSRGIIPAVSLPLSFDEMLADSLANDISLFCYENGGQAIHSRLDGVRTVSVITGCEGGFSSEEALKAAEAGCTVIGLGKRILRCELAPIAALCSVMTLTDNLQ